jgi:hypothetical protein
MMNAAQVQVAPVARQAHVRWAKTSSSAIGGLPFGLEAPIADLVR